ncbi:murein L,D-transpeptidase catalytic domain-containing protein [Flavobacterium branchiicola]|uniref:Murein L,D-transpeptidase catalytic domain-containing protein n=1 Tax=Flavobacterium branchiicola TaxID=1114875 RepID=A0ABV9PGQ9_9FLAO|nr:murein L,D-transpeptidase catalytic domain family protein [Flavobacterium branchiicola]MBS7253745.1 murein L,D-transpeptidase catalytic domain family protein [Flavobacterium branchiicola]
MKKTLLIGFLILLIFIGYRISKKTTDSCLSDKNKRIDVQVDLIRKMINENSMYNSKIAFLIDMKIPSGKNRFFVYNLEENKIIDKGLVAHGSGSETGVPGKLKFSNTPNSLSTSLGSYYIGNDYKGKFGKAYKLYGLDETNSNAFKRDIVFHYYYDVPYKEKDGYICNSFGCPMVSKKYFDRISKIIDNSESSILLNIYY